jgi:hypothetical protein
LNGACVDCQPGSAQCCSGNTGNQTCDSTGHWPSTCTSCGGTYHSCSGAGVCSCSGAPSPCKSQDQCGTRTDACGVIQYCGTTGDGSCVNTGQTCAYNSTGGYYYCKTMTTTGCAVCPCCGSCCGKYCC